ncbi:hypothetical protein SDRG_12393 [Saprolegnia diclina VS20]|uniref:Uncharacterized protein n=1 Tax=Saprolegnia diclina (strain VS20) TaxID=1156394 RepID=T0RIY2_SAPDV|nr:hypothetical protein SDRG_12393 [Saprolegnia diclina VS20]EQC29847.1 hypothetical protein SDRG_12393 [Saprolegnia diclina VS20]|eukprot:XP_008616686.1 hypothetical protein SDRG_12393 [Saprolegnia diclina VS20]
MGVADEVRGTKRRRLETNGSADAATAFAHVTAVASLATTELVPPSVTSARPAVPNRVVAPADGARQGTASARKPTKAKRPKAPILVDMAALGGPSTASLLTRLEKVEATLDTVLNDLFRKLPTLVADAVQTKVTAQGSAQLDGVFHDLRSTVETCMQEALQKLRPEFTAPAAATAPVPASAAPPLSLSTPTQTLPPPSSVPRFEWGGRLHPVPHDFMLPKMTVLHLWRAWFSGAPDCGMVPLQQLSTRNLPVPADAARFSKARRVVAFIASSGGAPSLVKLATSEALARENVFEIGCRRAAVKFRAFSANPDAALRTFQDLSYTTCYDAIRKLEKADAPLEKE